MAGKKNTLLEILSYSKILLSVKMKWVFPINLLLGGNNSGFVQRDSVGQVSLCNFYATMRKSLTISSQKTNK